MCSAWQHPAITWLHKAISNYVVFVYSYLPNDSDKQYKGHIIGK